MKYSVQRVAAVAALSLGVGSVVNSFLPRRFAIWDELEETTFHKNQVALPTIDITFLRCGSVVIPEFVAVRGAFSLAPRLFHIARYSYVTLEEHFCMTLALLAISISPCKINLFCSKIRLVNLPSSNQSPVTCTIFP